MPGTYKLDILDILSYITKTLRNTGHKTINMYVPGDPVNARDQPTKDFGDSLLHKKTPRNSVCNMTANCHCQS